MGSSIWYTHSLHSSGHRPWEWFKQQPLLPLIPPISNLQNRHSFPHFFCCMLALDDGTSFGAAELDEASSSLDSLGDSSFRGVELDEA